MKRSRTIPRCARPDATSLISETKRRPSGAALFSWSSTAKRSVRANHGECRPLDEANERCSHEQVAEEEGEGEKHESIWKRRAREAAEAEAGGVAVPTAP